MPGKLILRAARGSVIATLLVGSVAVVAEAAPATSAPVASAVSGLQQGSQGVDVTSLQKALIAAGIPVAGGADGVFGPATKGAVIAYQQARGLPVTGVVDHATADALGITSSTGSIGSTGVASTGHVGLQPGGQGDAVKELQRKLLDFGVYLGSGANGIWGSSTTRGVKQFQRWNGLTVTGTVNEATSKRLGLGSTTTTTTTQPNPSSTSNPYVGLKQGANGPLVKELQQALQGIGLVIRGGADGDFGAGTTSAVKAFQGFNGLTKNGIVSQRAAELLKLGTGAATPPPAASSPYLGLKVGATGPRVRDVQQALMAAGVSVRGGADGAFGLVTKSALASYQKATGITADGTVNQATIDKLGLGSSRGPAPFASTNETNATTTTTTSSSPYVGLKVGSIGPLVKELQQALQGTGLVVRGGADGVFGGSTASSLKVFQRVNGISQTGVVTERGAKLLALGTGTVHGTANPSGGGGSITLDHFPVQGQCFFGNTWGAPRGGGRKHEGVDIIAAEGKFLYAVVDGEISKLYWDQPGALSGNGMRVAQPNGTYFTYLHMLSFAPGIKVGTKVKAGDVIGFVGNTGSSATPHVHFEIHPNGGGAVNPYPYVKAIDDCNNTTPQYQGTFT